MRTGADLGLAPSIATVAAASPRGDGAQGLIVSVLVAVSSNSAAVADC
jgi:hypothetical protein